VLSEAVAVEAVDQAGAALIVLAQAGQALPEVHVLPRVRVRVAEFREADDLGRRLWSSRWLCAPRSADRRVRPRGGEGGQALGAGCSCSARCRCWVRRTWAVSRRWAADRCGGCGGDCGATQAVQEVGTRPGFGDEGEPQQQGVLLLLGKAAISGRALSL
jgi:hypothetical protein